MAKSNNKTHQKRMDKNCHIPDLVQAFSNVEKSKNMKILNSEENSKRKIKNQKAKSKVQTHQTNG